MAALGAVPPQTDESGRRGSLDLGHSAFFPFIYMQFASPSWAGRRRPEPPLVLAVEVSKAAGLSDLCIHDGEICR